MSKKCTRCRWSDNEFVNCTSYFGNPDADIVFVGEAFGLSEVKKGEAFVGKAGKILDKLLEVINLSRDEIAIMNSMRCYQPSNPTPTKKEMDACFIYTYKDIKQINPNLVVALGDSALYQVSGITGVKVNRGRLFWSDKIQCNVFCTYHPAAAIYERKRWGDLVEDFEKIPTVLHGYKPEIIHYDYTYIDDKEQVELALNNLAQSEIIYFDTESTGLSPYKDNLHLIQLGGEENYIFDPNVLNDAKVIENKKVCGQTFEHDVKMIAVQKNMFFNNWYHDTCLAEYILTGMKDNDLTALTAKYVPESAGYDNDVVALGGAHKLIGKDEKKLRQYASDDIGVLPKIMKLQRKQLEEEGMLWLFDNIIMPTNKILTKMSLRGVLFDVDEINKVDRMFEKRANRALLKAMNLDSVEACQKHFGKKFNPRSSEMIKWMILEHYKLPVLQYTKKDKPSVGKREMERYAEEFNNPYCRLMEQYRSYQVLRDGFLSGVLPKIVDGVAHTRYSLHSTTTGRPNSKDPNLLNWPRDKELKRCIIARPNHKFVYSDFAQLEMRLASVIYNDESLREICNDVTKDIHSNITAKAFGKTYEEVYNGYKQGDQYLTELRVAGKTVGFGVLYQIGAKKLSYQLKISEEKGQAFIDDFYKNFPSLRKNIDELKQLVIKQGYIDNYFKFRRRWKFHSEEDHNTIREAVNFPIQSLGFNLLALSMIQIDKELERRSMKSALLMQVYDSIVVEAVEEEVDEVIDIIYNIMNHVIDPFENINRVKLKSDVQIGYNLAELEEVKI